MQCLFPVAPEAIQAIGFRFFAKTAGIEPAKPYGSFVIAPPLSTYEGRDYIWMELNIPDISMNRNTPKWMMEMIDKCRNVFDIAKVFGPLVLSDANISSVRNPQKSEGGNQSQALQRSKGPRRR